MSAARAAVIEIVEKRKTPAQDTLGGSIVVPNTVRINGQPVLTTADPIIVGDLSSSSPVTVTVTLIARALIVAHEDADAAGADATARLRVLGLLPETGNEAPATAGVTA